MKQQIELSTLDSLEAKRSEERTNRVLEHALSNNPFWKVLKVSNTAENTNFTFSVNVPTMACTNQRSSGRCWLFSALNVLRESISKKLNIKGNFELSQNFLSYYDKLEKYNYLMENVASRISEKKDDRELYMLLKDGVSDGGQWIMFLNLVKKYGLMPKACFSETYQSEETRHSNILCNSILRQFAAALRKDPSKKDELKEYYFSRIYDVLTNSFGIPPKEFTFEYEDKDSNVHRLEKMTPLSFFQKYVGEEIDEYVSVINAPTQDKPYFKRYEVKMVGNVIEGEKTVHFNVPYKRFEEMIIAQLKDGDLVWFGSDVSYFRDVDCHLWDDTLFDYKSAFDIELSFSKEEMLDNYQAMMNHAMVLCGVDLVDEKPIRWKVENSWGTVGPNNGYYIMSESFFEKFVFQAAIKKKYFTEEELKALEEEPTLLPPWDPFGTLAD